MFIEPKLELTQMRQSFARLSSATARRQMNELLGAAGLARVGMEFESSTDPYGKPWAPLTSRDGMPLRDTGRALNSFYFRRLAGGGGQAGFRLSTDVGYVATHQYGATISAKRGAFLRFRVGGSRPRTGGQWVQKQTVVIPKRQIVPEPELGPIWFADFDGEITRYITALFAG